MPSPIGGGGGDLPLDEAEDIRRADPIRSINDDYASGYATSKWAGEVLLREANEHYGLPVTVFRSSMILAHSQQPNQLNVTDMFTRLLISVIETGMAPASFYQQSNEPPHYDGLPVDFTARSITTLGLGNRTGFETYHVVNPHKDGISLDSFVDWLDEVGVPVQRIHPYENWFRAFSEAHQRLDETTRAQSLFPLLHSYQSPLPAVAGSPISSARFVTALNAYPLPGFGDTPPSIGRDLIEKYLKDLLRMEKVRVV
ncbi:SDR family oxidoreductase [Vibrio ouci]|uniref:Thioester reductase (TE) domain-containing protein n=1 Tax=Vibrio ouci TaxID=2499078 RepID=A0A4Y8WAJ6_9VIBR|nr:SDR family oxidoreductase [Vibrio ouci]TFH89666.1 hypothetical protein ELS82_21065 [Vibrio ouci]